MRKSSKDIILDVVTRELEAEINYNETKSKEVEKLENAIREYIINNYNGINLINNLGALEILTEKGW